MSVDSEKTLDPMQEFVKKVKGTANFDQQEQGNETPSSIQENVEENSEKTTVEPTDAPEQSNSEEANDAPTWDWNTDETTETSEESNENDFLGRLKTDLGVEGDFDYNKFVENYKKPKEYANDHLAKADEIAKNGGDYKSYLKIAETDYNNLSPEEAYKKELISKGLTLQEASDYIDNLDPVELKLRGGDAKDKLVQNQAAQMQKYENEAIERKNMLDSQLKGQLDKLDNVFNLKVDNREKNKAFEGLSTGEAIRSMFYKPNGQLKETAARDLIAFKNLEKVVKHNISLAKNEGVRSVIQEAEGKTQSNASKKSHLDNKGKPLNAYQKFLQYANGNNRGI